ncbi:hypothetical protein AAFP94_14770 [Flavobacteriaceae bacterium MJ-SS4]|uniref:hypothetical protein n=1 Tax=Gilvirhabdus luticola TaxID=3079858 RepID=UPI0032DCB565
MKINYQSNLNPKAYNIINKFVFSIVICFTITNAWSQSAVLYNFDFRVPDAYRHEIQEYDQKGKKKYKKDYYGKMVLDKYLEPISVEEVHSICESAAEMFKRKYGYTDVKMMYPTGSGSTTGKVSNFPNKGFKKAVKKNTVDAYITMEFRIENRVFAPQTSLYYEEKGMERTMFMNITLSYTIFNAQENIIDQKEISLKDELDQLFSENYNSEIVEKGYKLRKLYLTKEELFSIYELAEQKIEVLE